jgi:hypothetical protein
MTNSLNQIHITLLIESDYRKRGVFPMLRLDQASKVSGSMIVFENITMNLVLALKADAEAQRGFATRSMKLAYGAIVKQMDSIIRRPEIEKERRQRDAIKRQEFKEEALKMCAGYTRFIRMMCWKDDGYRFDNETLTDVEGTLSKLVDIISEGRVVHPKDDESEPASEVTPDCKSDITLQNFLKAAAGDLSLVKNESQEGL